MWYDIIAGGKLYSGSPGEIARKLRADGVKNSEIASILYSEDGIPLDLDEVIQALREGLELNDAEISHAMSEGIGMPERDVMDIINAG